MDKIVIYHTPDADDAFMFYPLFNRKVETNFEFLEKVEDIETLNQKIFKEALDISALSAYTFGMVSDRYYALGTGASFGEGYGPIIVANEKINPEKIKDCSIAVPGKFTSSYLLYRLTTRAKIEVTMRFDNIINAVKNKEADLGLLIHEGQLTYTKYGLFKVLDLYEWWTDQVGKLPLPLGLNVINKKFEFKKVIEIKKLIQKSIRYAINNPDEAISFASEYGRGVDLPTLKKFAMQYVNERTYEMGEEGRSAILKLLDLAKEHKLLNTYGKIEIL